MPDPEKPPQQERLFFILCLRDYMNQQRETDEREWPKSPWRKAVGGKRTGYDRCPFGESIKQKRDIVHMGVIACVRSKSNRSKRRLLAVQLITANHAR